MEADLYLMIYLICMFVNLYSNEPTHYQKFKCCEKLYDFFGCLELYHIVH